MASTFHTFLLDTHMDLRDLNGNQMPFTDMFSVPVTPKVKLLYGLGYRTSGIGQVSPIAKKFLALFCKGSSTVVPAQVIMVENSVCT